MSSDKPIIDTVDVSLATVYSRIDTLDQVSNDLDELIRQAKDLPNLP